MTVAYRETGVKEIMGDEHHMRILEYHQVTDLQAKTDEVPWCSAFICWCMEKCAIPSTRSALARSWLNWGIELEKPKEGCVVVLWRGRKDGPSGHVGLFVKETEKSVYVLGGNQDNSVRLSSYSKERVLGYRWPSEEYLECPVLQHS